MKLYVFFTFNTSLKDWFLNGSLDRELNYYEKLQKRGLEIFFITYGTDDSRFLKKDSPIKVISIFDKKSNFKIINFFKSFLFVWKFSKYNQGNIVIKSNQMKGSWLPLMISKIYSKKMILRCGYEYYRFGLKNRNSGVNFIKYILSYLSYNFADKIVITSNYEKNFINKKFKIDKKKIALIPNYIDTSIFKKKNDKKSFDIIYVGRFERQKNLFFLINSIKELKLKIILIGNGSLSNDVRESLKNSDLSFKIIKRVKNNKLPEFYNKSHIFLNTSLYEGNPKSVLEAMACGLNIITTKYDGVGEIISNNFNGIITKYCHKEIKKNINYLLKNKNVYKKISNNAQKKIISKNCIEKILFLETKEILSL